MSKDVEISYSFGDKRKASPEALDKETAKRPAISGLIEPSLTTRFLSDPIISDICNNLAKDQFIVQRAHQLLEAFQGSTVMEDGNFNDSAFEHFSLVRRTWRNHKLRVGIDKMIVKECVVPDIIDKLSNDVEDEKIEERMCRIKGDHDLGRILQLPNHPATMIRGLLIILFGYWRYRKLPSRSGEEIRTFDEDIGSVTKHLGFGIIINKDWSDMEIEMHRLQSEAHTTWLLEHATPIQKLDEELFIDKLADDLKDLCLFGKAKKCMEYLHKFNPKDDGTSIFAMQHRDLAHEVLEDSDFVHFLFDSIKRSNEGREYVEEYGKRAKVENEDVVATVKNIVKDPGFLQYKERIEKNEVRAALRVFLSILITHWMYEDVREKVNEKLHEYALAEQKAEDDAWKATGYDDVEDDICYHTRFAGDLKGLKEALEKVYGTRPYEHMFNEIRIMQFEQEVITREKQFDAAMVVKVSLYHGSWAYSSFDFHDN